MAQTSIGREPRSCRLIIDYLPNQSDRAFLESDGRRLPRLSRTPRVTGPAGGRIGAGTDARSWPFLLMIVKSVVLLVILLVGIAYILLRGPQDLGGGAVAAGDPMWSVRSGCSRVSPTFSSSS